MQESGAIAVGELKSEPPYPAAIISADRPYTLRRVTTSMSRLLGSPTSHALGSALDALRPLIHSAAASGAAAAGSVDMRAAPHHRCKRVRARCIPVVDEETDRVCSVLLRLDPAPAA